MLHLVCAECWRQSVSDAFPSISLCRCQHTVQGLRCFDYHLLNLESKDPIGPGLRCVTVQSKTIFTTDMTDTFKNGMKGINL